MLCYDTGRIGSGWRVGLSSWPWLEGKQLFGAAATGARLQGIKIDVEGDTAKVVEQGHPRMW